VSLAGEGVHDRKEVTGDFSRVVQGKGRIFNQTTRDGRENGGKEVETVIVGNTDLIKKE
jgi:hypothetical protein